VLQKKGGSWGGTELVKEHPEDKTAVNKLQQGRLMYEVVTSGKEEATEPAAAKLALLGGPPHGSGGSRVSKIPLV